MGMSEVLERITDPYQRQARLWPALLALFPLLTLLGIIYGPMMSIFTAILSLAGSCGVLYLVTSIARELGKRLESKLFVRWGGKPSTQLLRHREPTIEGVTKRRYHDFLSRKLNEQFPTQDDEAKQPTQADEFYQSGVRWLLNKTRDQQVFDLLFKENISYGFRRNAQALKPIGLSVSFVTILWVFFFHRVIDLSTNPIVNISALTTLPETAIMVLAVSVLMIAVWLIFFTSNTTRTAAFTYAETLLRACDVLDKS